MYRKSLVAAGEIVRAPAVVSNRYGQQTTGVILPRAQC